MTKLPTSAGATLPGRVVQAMQYCCKYQNRSVRTAPSTVIWRSKFEGRNSTNTHRRCSGVWSCSCCSRSRSSLHSSTMPTKLRALAKPFDEHLPLHVQPPTMHAHQLVKHHRDRSELNKIGGKQHRSPSPMPLPQRCSCTWQSLPSYQRNRCL